MLSDDVYLNSTGILAFPDGDKFALVIIRTDLGLSGLFVHYKDRSKTLTLKQPLRKKKGVHTWQSISII